MIQVFKPHIGEEEIRAVAEVLASGWIGLGPRTKEFEDRFAEYSGVRHAVGVNSCTAALDLALKLLDIHKGDEVLVPSITFVSTAHVVAYNDATPIFCEPDERTLSIDLEDAARRISPRTRAIIVVHYGGRMIDPAALEDFARTHRLMVIEDCAHAAGARHGDRRAGSIGEIGCFSFHAVKNLAMGDGGALTLNDDARAERARRLRWLGIDKGTWSRTSTDRAYWWEYSVGEIGLKCHMNDIAAAIGLVQLSRLETANDRRRQIAGLYSDGLADLGDVVTPPMDDEISRSAWHIYHILAQDRDSLSEHLRLDDINTGVHYKPIHLYRCYGAQAALPRAEGIFPRLLSLPMYPDLSDDDVARIIDSIRTFYGKRRLASPPPSLPEARLRPAVEGDLERLRAWRNDPDIRIWFFDDSEISAAAQRSWWERYSRAEDDRLFLIEDAGGKPVGTVGLDHIDPRHGNAELGRCILGDPGSRGRGLMSAAILELCRHAFGPLGLRRLYLEVRLDNERAITLYERCGFRREGVLRGARVIGGEARDILTMALLAEEFTGALVEPARPAAP